jgi:RND family efflux transporter MFP subunit
MNRIVKVAAPVGILALGALGAGGLIASGGAAQRATPEAPITPVEVLTLQPVDAPALVVATGVVRPDREVTVLPQVGGRIVSTSERLVPGGRFAAGEVMAQIDPRDYQLSVRQAESQLAQAHTEYQLEEGRQATARREWALVGDDRPAVEAAMALRAPQKAQAERALASAEAGLEQARLNLSRSSLTAPFNALVVSESVDVGQVVGASSQVARLVGTDRFRVEVSVPFEQLTALDIPGVNAPVGEGAGSRAVITHALGAGRALTREGRVLSLAGELDPQTRNARLLVVIDDPLEAAAGELPLMPGAFVDVVLHGRAVEGAYEVPRSAVYDGDRVWTVDAEGRLDAVEVTAGWSDAEHLLVTAGLSPGAQIVVSPLSLPLEGAPVRASQVD